MEAKDRFPRMKDTETLIREAKQVGFEIGIEQGKAEGRREVAEWLYGKCACVVNNYPSRVKVPQGKSLRIDCWKCRMKLKEWGIENGKPTS